MVTVNDSNAEEEFFKDIVVDVDESENKDESFEIKGVRILSVDKLFRYADVLISV